VSAKIVAGTLFIAGTHASPGTQVFGCGELIGIWTNLSKNRHSRIVSQPGNGLQQVHETLQPERLDAFQKLLIKNRYLLLENPQVLKAQPIMNR
jgi:hypothetical protein